MTRQRFVDKRGCRVKITHADAAARSKGFHAGQVHYVFDVFNYPYEDSDRGPLFVLRRNGIYEGFYEDQLRNKPTHVVPRFVPSRGGVIRGRRKGQ